LLCGGQVEAEYRSRFVENKSIIPRFVQLHLRSFTGDDHSKVIFYGRFSFQLHMNISGKDETQLTAKEEITFQNRTKARLLYAHAITKMEKCENVLS